ncbi:MAG: DUF2125 domain-containing protein [Boseongicola sp.]
MKSFRTFSTASAFTLLAAPALADLTAAEVWGDWQGLMANYGAEVTTTGQSSSGGTLTITGIATEFEVPDGSVSLLVGDVSFEELGDGSVAVRMPETMPISVDVTTPEGEGKVGFTLNQPGASMIASGDAASLRYDFDYPTFGMGEFTIQGEDIPDDLPIFIDFALNNMAGYINLSEGDVRSYDTESTIASMVMDISFADPEGEEGEGSFKFSVADLTQKAQGAIVKIDMNMSVAEMITAGMRQTGTATHGTGSYTVEFDGPDGSFKMLATATSGLLDAAFDENGISYGGKTNDVAVTVSGSVLPLPAVNLRMAESGGRFTMPMVPGEDPQDFALVMRMIGLEIDDMIWGMFDPAGQLPRDPATLIVDLAGKAILTEDFTDPEFAENMEAEAPGTLEEVNINALQLTMAGAESTGDGAFTFNNSIGIPMPAGVANLMLVGGNGLLDKLVGMGLLPDEQAMGARMMMGLFARPGDGPDTLVSTIEVKEDGSVLANGQRIK